MMEAISGCAHGLTTNAESWKENALGVINKVMREPLRMKVVNVIGGAPQDWATAELEANGVAKDGEPSVEYLRGP